MKTIIFYATKHGFAKKCALKLSEKLQGEVEIINLKENKKVELEKYDKVIIGSSIYMGQIIKEAREFCKENMEQLSHKKIGLFVCCMSEQDKVNAYFEQFFPKEFENNVFVKSNFGGGFTFKAMNFFERFIIKAITKQSTDLSNLKENNIDEFAAKIN